MLNIATIFSNNISHLLYVISMYVILSNALIIKVQERLVGGISKDIGLNTRRKSSDAVIRK